MAKNAIVGQSGGPTSVINASLAGVYESCKRRGAGKVYGMLHGVAGLLERRTCVLDDKLKTALDIELLKRTPSSYLGSCRYKLPDWHTAEGERVYIRLFEILKELDIGCPAVAFVCGTAAPLAERFRDLNNLISPVSLFGIAASSCC